MLEAASCTATPKIYVTKNKIKEQTQLHMSLIHITQCNYLREMQVMHVNFTRSSQREKVLSSVFSSLSNGMCQAWQDGGIKLCSKCFESYQRGCGGKERGGQRVGACEARLPTPTAHTSGFLSPAPPGRARCRLMSVQWALEVFLWRQLQVRSSLGQQKPE